MVLYLLSEEVNASYKNSRLKKEKILTSNAEKFIKDSKFGASIYFLGTVRNINDNKSVTGITYDSHDEMVIKSFEEIYNEADQKLDIKDKAVFIELSINL